MTRPGSLLTWHLCTRHFGVYGLVGPTLPQVALQGPRGAFPAIDDWSVDMALTWPWWFLQCSQGRVELATLLTVVFLY